MFTIGTEIDFAARYEAAAEYVARVYGRPIEPMLCRAMLDLDEETFEDIEANPHHFAERVNTYMYAMAMA